MEGRSSVYFARLSFMYIYKIRTVDGVKHYLFIIKEIFFYAHFFMWQYEPLKFNFACSV